MNQPTVSVLMPVYNAERYVTEAVQSVLSQTFTDFEFIIIDDGSTDGSLGILKGFVERDGRVRLVSRGNTGYVVALNEMLELARGEFVARMDADDVSMPDRLMRQVQHLRAHPECVAVGSRTLLIDSEGLPICPWEQPLTHEAIDAEHLKGRGGAMTHPAVMIRASSMRRAGGYHPAYYPAEDVDLFLRLAEAGRLANLQDVLLQYRQHSQSVGYARRSDQIRGMLAAVKDAHHRRGLAANQVTPPPVTEPTDAAEHHRKWAWWALGAGHVATARKHAWARWVRAPLSWKSWKLMACALRGH